MILALLLQIKLPSLLTLCKKIVIKLLIKEVAIHFFLVSFQDVPTFPWIEASSFIIGMKLEIAPSLRGEISSIYIFQ